MYLLLFIHTSEIPVDGIWDWSGMAIIKEGSHNKDKWSDTRWCSWELHSSALISQLQLSLFTQGEGRRGKKRIPPKFLVPDFPLHTQKWMGGEGAGGYQEKHPSSYHVSQQLPQNCVWGVTFRKTGHLGVGHTLILRRVVWSEKSVSRHLLEK